MAQGGANMSHTNKAVRYYIDRDGSAPVVRTVPVRRADQPNPQPVAECEAGGDTTLATSRRRSTRNRLTSMVMAPVRRHHHHQS